MSVEVVERKMYEIHAQRMALREQALALRRAGDEEGLYAIRRRQRDLAERSVALRRELDALLHQEEPNEGTQVVGVGGVVEEVT